MKAAITYLLTAGLVTAGIALGAGVQPAKAADTKTWYVYCEGNRQGDHWAVFSENIWPHPMTEGYGRDLARAAKSFFESRHNVQLEGCAGVNFVDSSLAEHSRSRTAQLHKKMGDRVFYFRLPTEAMPVEPVSHRVAAEAQVAADMGAARPKAAQAALRAPAAQASEPRPTFRPQRAER